MDKPTRIKGICRKFTGVFHKKDWETIKQMGKTIQRMQMKVIETDKGQGLILTSKDGVFNIYRDSDEPGVVTGSLFLKGDSVKDIIRQPIWSVFHTAAHSFQTNAVIEFYPVDGQIIQYEKGVVKEQPLSFLPGMESAIDHFLKQIRIDYLLKQLSLALKLNDPGRVSSLKMQLLDLATQN